MALRQAKFLTYGDDEQCAEVKKFIEEAGVILEYRDIEKKPLTEDELTALIQQAIKDIAPASVKDMAKVMNFIKERAQGRADMAQVSARVKGLLGF